MPRGGKVTGPRLHRPRGLFSKLVPRVLDGLALPPWLPIGCPCFCHALPAARPPCLEGEQSSYSAILPAQNKRLCVIWRVRGAEELTSTLPCSPACLVLPARPSLCPVLSSRGD